jgi:hypothetical protein
MPMIANPFSRKPKRPVDRALDAFDAARSEAAAYAASIRDGAAGVAETLTEIGPPDSKRRLPAIAIAAAAVLGVAYAVRKRLESSAPGPVPEVPGPPSAAETASRTTAQPAPDSPLAPTVTEAPREPAAATSESETAERGKGDAKGTEEDVAATGKG